jgi:hypothetical protein
MRGQFCRQCPYARCRRDSRSAKRSRRKVVSGASFPRGSYSVPPLSLAAGKSESSAVSRKTIACSACTDASCGRYRFRFAISAALESVYASAFHATREPLFFKMLVIYFGSFCLPPFVCKRSARFACYFLIQRRWRDCQLINSIRGIAVTPDGASPR